MYLVLAAVRSSHSGRRPPLFRGKSSMNRLSLLCSANDILLTLITHNAYLKKQRRQSQMPSSTLTGGRASDRLVYAHFHMDYKVEMRLLRLFASKVLYVERKRIPSITRPMRDLVSSNTNQGCLSTISSTWRYFKWPQERWTSCCVFEKVPPLRIVSIHTLWDPR